MSAFVLDSSVLLSWILADEASEVVDALRPRLLESGAWAPALLPFEVSNVLIQAEKRGRIERNVATELLTLVQKLPISLDDEAYSLRLLEVATLARTHRLTTYDASYLELAIRKHCALASLDQALRTAANARDVELLPA